MKNILGVDRWTKYIGFAYRNEKSNMIMPIGYLMNDDSLFFNVGELIGRYFIGTVAIGWPKQHKDSQEAIDVFIENILFIEHDLEIKKVNEEYTTVQAWATNNNFNKNEAEDSIAAMHLLEYYMQSRTDWSLWEGL